MRGDALSCIEAGQEPSRRHAAITVVSVVEVLVAAMTESLSVTSSVAPVQGEDHDPVIGATLFCGSILAMIGVAIARERSRRGN